MNSLELKMANQGTSTVPVVLAQFLSLFVLYYRIYQGNIFLSSTLMFVV